MLLDNLKQSGIYKITALLTGDFYIGSAYNLKKRLGEHRNMLLKNKHKNSRLQNAYNEQGIENFTFEVYDTCQKHNCKKLEQSYIDIFGPTLNISQKTQGRDTYNHRQETKDKISKTLLGHPGYFKGGKHTEEARSAISKALTGKPLSKEHKESISKNRKGFASFAGKKHNDETKDAIRRANRGNTFRRGKKLSTETKQLLSELNTGENNPNFGLKRSETTKELQRQRQLLVPKIKCTYCDIISTPQSIARWHNENCKLKSKCNSI